MDTSKILTILCAFILVVCLTLCITSLVTLRNAIEENEAVQSSAMEIVAELDHYLDTLQKTDFNEDDVSVSVTPSETECCYFLIRATDYGIGIYSTEGYLIKQLNVAVSSLPLQDQQLLKEGIKAESWKEIISYIQDYGA